MADFDLRHSPYIALVRRADVEATPDDPVRAAIYAPGTVCAFYADHEQAAASTSYALLVQLRDGSWGLVGPRCLEGRFGHADPRPWRTALDRRHPLAGTRLGVDWRSQTRREYWRLVPLVGLMLQVEPAHRALRKYLTRATREGKRALTAGEKRVLLAILRERGGPALAKGRDRESWDRELRGHLRVLKTRRDLVFRLGRLAALDLEPGDGETVDSLQAACVQRWEGRMRTLTEAQAHLVVTLEARYFDQRAGASAALAQALGDEGA